MVHGTQDMVHGACTAISGADRYRGGKKPSSGLQHVSENLGKRGCCRLTLPAAATTVLGIGLDPSFLPLCCPSPVPTYADYYSQIFWFGYCTYDGGQLARYCGPAQRMLNGQRGSSDDHPWLMTARDVPARASQKPYGTREEGLMRGRLAGIWGKERMFGDWGRKEQGHDATRLSASRFVIRATWICMACVEAIRYGMKRWSIIYGSTGMMHMYCFGSRLLLPRCLLLVAPDGIGSANKVDHPTVPMPFVIPESESVGALPHSPDGPSLRIVLQGAASKAGSLVSGMA